MGVFKKYTGDTFKNFMMEVLAGHSEADIVNALNEGGFDLDEYGNLVPLEATPTDHIIDGILNFFLPTESD